MSNRNCVEQKKLKQIAPALLQTPIESTLSLRSGLVTKRKAKKNYISQFC